KHLENRQKWLHKLGITHRVALNVLPLFLLFLFNFMLTLKMDHLVEFPWAVVFSPLFLLWLWSVWNTILHFWAENVDRKYNELMGFFKYTIFFQDSLVAEIAEKIETSPLLPRIFPVISCIGLSAA